MSKYGVLSERELESRFEVAVENTRSKLNIEAETASAIARTMLLPAAVRHLNELIASQREGMIDEFAPIVGDFHQAIVALEKANEDPGLEGMELAHYFRDTVIPAMTAVRDARRQAREARRRRPLAAAEVLGDPVHQVARTERGPHAQRHRGPAQAGPSVVHARVAAQSGEVAADDRREVLGGLELPPTITTVWPPLRVDVDDLQPDPSEDRVVLRRSDLGVRPHAEHLPGQDRNRALSGRGAAADLAPTTGLPAVISDVRAGALAAQLPVFVACDVDSICRRRSRRGNPRPPCRRADRHAMGRAGRERRRDPEGILVSAVARVRDTAATAQALRIQGRDGARRPPDGRGAPPSGAGGTGRDAARLSVRHGSRRPDTRRTCGARDELALPPPLGQRRRPSRRPAPSPSARAARRTGARCRARWTASSPASSR